MVDYAQRFQTLVTRRLEQVWQAAEDDTFIQEKAKQTQAIQALTYAIAGTPEDPTFVIKLLCHLAPLMEQTGHRDPWYACLRQGAMLCQQRNDQSSAAELCYHIGVLFHRQSRFDEAKAWLSSALDTFRTANQTVGQSKVLHQLAHIACLQSNYDLAADLVQQAASLAGNDLTLQAMTYFIKGLLQAECRDWSQAETFHRSALALRIKVGDQRRIAWSLLDVASALMHQKRYSEAASCFQQSALILESLLDIHSWARVQMNLGLLFYESGDLQLALDYYQAALPPLQAHCAILDLAKLHTNLGIVLLDLDQSNGAEAAFMASIKHFRSVHDNVRALNAVDGLAMALLAQARYSDAIAQLENGLAELPLLQQSPQYHYLLQSMQQHLAEAHSHLVLAEK